MKNKPNKINVNVEVEITDNDIDDIVCTALEGGIHYWAKRAEIIGKRLGENPHQQIAKKGKLLIHLTEPFDKNNTSDYTLTKSKTIKGIKQYLENPDKPYDIFDTYEEGKFRLDTCQVDSIVADMIIQYALFNEIIFA